MVISLEEIYANIKDVILLDEEFSFDKEKYHMQDIIDLQPIHFCGKIEKDSNEEIVLRGKLSGTMTILDSISLEEVNYQFSSEIEENLEDFLEKNKNTIDILEILWQNIVLEVPLRYTEVTDYSKYSGDGWKLMSEEELKYKNNPFRALLENEKEE